MDSIFLNTVIGSKGATALEKAIAKAPILRSVVIPRTIVSWLSVLKDIGFDGSIPGVENSYLSVAKSSNDLISGALTINDKLYMFEDADLLHVAASLGVALNLELEPLDHDLKRKDLTKLGKSIDLLVKNEFIKTISFDITPLEIIEVEENLYDIVLQSNQRVILEKIETLEKAKNVASIISKKLKKKSQDSQEPHGGPVPPSGHFEQVAPLSPAMQAGITSHKSKPTPPFKNIVGGQGRAVGGKERLTGAKFTKVKITKSESEKICPDCANHYFNHDRFTGCLCLSDLSKNISTEKTDGGFLLKFDKEMDEDSISTVVEILK